MSRKCFALALLAACCCLAGMFIAGCEDNNDDLTPLDVTGSWRWTGIGNNAGTMRLAAGVNRSAPGTFRFGSSPWTSGTIDGEARGNLVVLTFHGDNGWTAEAKADVKNGRMDGVWSDSNRSSGTWTAQRL